MPKDYPYYWSMGLPKEIRFSYIDSLGDYLFIYNKILEILKVVLEGEKLVEPEEDLQNRYVWLLEFFYVIPTREDFKHIPKIDFKKFASLLNVDMDFVDEWKKQKPKYLDYLRLLDAEFKATRYSYDHVKAPRNLMLMMSSLEDCLKRHAGTMSSDIKTGATRDGTSLAFTANKSHKKSVYQILEKNMKEWINKKELMKTAKINYNDFRSIIAQLRKDIINQKLSKKFKIESDKKSSYRLVNLAS